MNSISVSFSQLLLGRSWIENRLRCYPLQLCWHVKATRLAAAFSFSPHVPTPDGLKEATGDANVTRAHAYAHAHMHNQGATPHPGEPSYRDPCRDQNERIKERGATSKWIWMDEKWMEWWRHVWLQHTHTQITFKWNIIWKEIGDDHCYALHLSDGFKVVADQLRPST